MGRVEAMTNEELEGLQSDANDIESSLNEASQHLMSATSCDSPRDFKANMLELRATLKSAIDDVNNLLKNL